MWTILGHEKHDFSMLDIVPESAPRTSDGLTSFVVGVEKLEKSGRALGFGTVTVLDVDGRPQAR